MPLFNINLAQIYNPWPLCHEPGRGGHHSYPQWESSAERTRWGDRGCLHMCNRENEENTNFMGRVERGELLIPRKWCKIGSVKCWIQVITLIKYLAWKVYPDIFHSVLSQQYFTWQYHKKTVLSQDQYGCLKSEFFCYSSAVERRQWWVSWWSAVPWQLSWMLSAGRITWVESSSTTAPANGLTMLSW